MVAQQARADGVEGARPVEAAGQHGGLLAHHLAGDALDTPCHLGGGAARKGHEQDTARIGAGDDQMGDAVGERVGLAGAGAGNDQQRAGNGAAAMLHRGALRRVQPVEIAGQGGRIRRGDIHGAA